VKVNCPLHLPVKMFAMIASSAVFIFFFLSFAPSWPTLPGMSRKSGSFVLSRMISIGENTSCADFSPPPPPLPSSLPECRGA